MKKPGWSTNRNTSKSDKTSPHSPTPGRRLDYEAKQSVGVRRSCVAKRKKPTETRNTSPSHTPTGRRIFERGDAQQPISGSDVAGYGEIFREGYSFEFFRHLARHPFIYSSPHACIHPSIRSIHPCTHASIHTSNVHASIHASIKRLHLAHHSSIIAPQSLPASI